MIMYQGLSQEIAKVMPEAVATGRFVSVCTVEQASSTYTASGFPDGTFTPIIGVVDIPCTAPPPSVLKVSASENKQVDGVQSIVPAHVLLNGYYAQIPFATTGRPALRAVIDGNNYEIMGVERDSQKQMTRLAVRVAAR
jgi:hypothetical protein